MSRQKHCLDAVKNSCSRSRWWWVTNYEIPRFVLCTNTYISTSMHKAYFTKIIALQAITHCIWLSPLAWGFCTLPRTKILTFPHQTTEMFFYCFSCCVKYHFMICRIPHVIFYINSDATRFVFVSEVFPIVSVYIYIFLIFHKRPTGKRGTVKDTGSGVLR